MKSVLSDYFNQSKVEIGAHLNGDEAMALGAVFHAANLSHFFKLRPIWLYDGFGFAIRILIKNLNESLPKEK